MMTLQRLEGFYWVARTGGFARAARAFPYPITQPGVHQQVRRLEDELEVTLLERTGKDQMSLTPAGQALFDVVAPFYEQLPALAARLKGGKVGGTLKIQAAGHLLRHLMPQWLQRLQARHPEITVSLTEVAVADPSALLRGEADLLVDWLPSLPEGVEGREVAAMQAFVVAPTQGPYAHGPRLKLAELAKVPFIAYHADKAQRALQLAGLEQHGLHPPQAFTADSSDTILGFVAAGLGFSLVPSLLEAGPRVAGVAAWPVPAPKSRFPIQVAWRKRAIAHPLIEAALAAVP
jgi:DNA-binding transcriptional LysR family regulator